MSLTKHEVFEACQALADADRLWSGPGGTAEAGALGDLFELLEDRMTRTSARVGLRARSQPTSGSYSMESEFTQ